MRCAPYSPTSCFLFSEEPPTLGIPRHTTCFRSELDAICGLSSPEETESVLEPQRSATARATFVNGLSTLLRMYGSSIKDAALLNFWESEDERDRERRSDAWS